MRREGNGIAVRGIQKTLRARCPRVGSTRCREHYKSAKEWQSWETVLI